MPFPRANQSDPLFSVLPRRRPPDSLAATLPSSPLPKIKSRCRLGLGVGRQQDQNQPSRKAHLCKRLICARVQAAHPVCTLVIQRCLGFLYINPPALPLVQAKLLITPSMDEANL
ncbi:hypothetical protein BS78_K209600 [Paspalum vaginatum]|uniref:Uncharacterized protein n=1 Tax=Paspalum vaginatum TaxID=158149 RepID=A0A9W8CDF9_9POAL|nr:hypothetical protein BS78_K209600 [Paspalum vaginatum]